MCNTNDSLHHLLLHIHCHYSHHFVLIPIVRESSFQLIGRNYWIVLHFILLYNIYHPCATESLRFSFSRFFCAMAILLCSRAFSSSPTLASSNGFLVTTMV